MRCVPVLLTRSQRSDGHYGKGILEMDKDERDELPCGHTRDEHRAMFPPHIADLFEKAADKLNDGDIEGMEALLAEVDKVVKELGLDDGHEEPFVKSEWQEKLTRRAAEIFRELAVNEHEEPEDLEIVLHATSPHAPLKIKLTRLVRSTQAVKTVYEVETLPGVIGAVDLVMGSIGAVCLGLAEKEMQESLIGGIDGLIA